MNVANRTPSNCVPTLDGLAIGQVAATHHRIRDRQGRWFSEAQPHVMDAGDLEHQAIQKIRRPGDLASPPALACRQRDAVPKICCQQTVQPVHTIGPDPRHEHPVDAPCDQQDRHQSQPHRERQLQRAQQHTGQGTLVKRRVLTRQVRPPLPRPEPGLPAADSMGRPVGCATPARSPSGPRASADRVRHWAAASGSCATGPHGSMQRPGPWATAPDRRFTVRLECISPIDVDRPRQMFSI